MHVCIRSASTTRCSDSTPESCMAGCPIHCDDTSQVVTANRRLARVLAGIMQRISSWLLGCQAWRTSVHRTHTLTGYPEPARHKQSCRARADTHQHPPKSRSMGALLTSRGFSESAGECRITGRQAREMPGGRLHDWNVPLHRTRSVWPAAGINEYLRIAANSLWTSILDSGITGLTTR